MSKCCILLYALVSVTGCVAQSLPLQLPVNISSTNGVCPSTMTRGATRLGIQDRVSNLLRDSVIPALDSRPPCACGGPGEWTRIAHLNMSDTSQQCPANWSLITTPIRGCGQPSSISCHSATFQLNTTTYSRVCGRVLGYQQATPDAFAASIRSGVGLEDAYVDGVSLTHGPPGSRQHIWSFAAAIAEISSYSTVYICSCTNINQNWPHQVPSFVGGNYFCESGNIGPSVSYSTVYANDPLWDGAGCGPTSRCCEFNNPPWFCTTLPQPTTDDIELRICRDQGTAYENIIVSMFDIYIK